MSEVTDKYKASHPQMTGPGFERLHVCHHGPGECQGNLIQSCAMKMLPTEQSVDLVLCMAAAMRPFPNKGDFKAVQAARDCFESLGIDATNISDCALGPLGNRLLTEMGHRQNVMVPRSRATSSDMAWDRLGFNGEAPRHHGPVVMIDGQYLEENDDLWQTVCNKVSVAPASCVERVKSVASAMSGGSAKLNMWVGFQSKCPECSAFLNETFAPLWYSAGIRAKLNVELNCYGNTRELPMSEVTEAYKAKRPQLTGPGFERLHVCHHGPGECQGNLIQSCAFKLLSTEQSVELVLCMAAIMHTFPRQGDFKATKAARHCLEEQSIDPTEISDCALSPLGNRLFTEMGRRQQMALPRAPASKNDTAWDRPGFRGEAPENHGPVVLVNGLYVEDNDRLMEVVCDSLGDEKPASCLNIMRK